MNVVMWKGLKRRRPTYTQIGSCRERPAHCPAQQPQSLRRMFEALHPKALEPPQLSLSLLEAYSKTANGFMSSDTAIISEALTTS